LLENHAVGMRVEDIPMLSEAYKVRPHLSFYPHLSCHFVMHFQLLFTGNNGRSQETN
jgi:hypothetical protein